MAATTAIIHLLSTGDHVISIDDVYGGTQRYFRRTVVPVRAVVVTRRRVLCVRDATRLSAGGGAVPCRRTASRSRSLT
jgi:O-acetylhomoserine/O-acetylserine sulfhydrylase-like pyridoxal-dependent enzyme